MEIYLDYVFLENLIVNYFILFQVPILCKFRINKIRCLISSLLMSIYLILIQMLSNSIFQNLIVKLLIVAVTIYVSYKPSKIIEYIKYIIFYYMFYILYLGIIIFLTLFLNLNLENILVRLVIYLISAIILTLINKLMWKMWKNNIKNKVIYNIKIENFNLQGFVDTGNNVKDRINNLDVIFVSSNYKSKILSKIENLDTIKIDIKTAAGNEKMQGYIVKNAIIYDEKFLINIDKIVIIFIDSNLFLSKNYEALISYDTYIDKLKGVTLC